MSNPLLSIIIPYYNLELWLLKRCLESIFNQNLRKEIFEVIVIDDGSANSPESLVAAYGNYNITYFYQSNQGLSEARNSGVRLAKGDYIQFIDADDYLYENTVKKYISLLEQYNPDILNFDFRTCYKKIADKVAQPALTYKIYDSGAEYMNDNSHYLPAAAWMYVFKRELIFRNNLLFTKGIFHEDEEFTPFLYVYSAQVVTLNLIVYAYYQRVGSIVGRKDEEHLDIRYIHFKGVIERLHKFKEKNRMELNKLQQSALEKKVNLLACDYIVSMSRNRYPYHKLIQEVKYLKSIKLYPLPDKRYTLKYNLFRLLTSCKLGLKVIYVIEPLRTKLKKI